jgi:hypothetical protein
LTGLDKTHRVLIIRRPIQGSQLWQRSRWSWRAKRRWEAYGDSVVGGADVLDGAGKPREQAKEDEIEVYRDIILHIPREQAKEDEIEV